MTNLRLVLNVLVVSCLLLLPSIVRAERFALLIGVSAYPSYPGHSLDGPKNDVQLMRDLLKAQGFPEANITILADQVPEAKGLPTRANIFGELSALAARVGRGDFVYIQFSGHGSQQPSRPGRVPPKPDGMDETFIPRDIGKWDGTSRTVLNAVRDEEIGKAFTAIRDKGAFVWAVFDSCHSGYITRGDIGMSGLRERRLDPKVLGIPQESIDSAVAKARRDAVVTRGGNEGPEEALSARDEGDEQKGRGGSVYFYATMPEETTSELDLPERAKYAHPYGLFTYTLAQVISANPGITYHQAGERILQLYGAMNLRMPTPIFEGSMLDAPLFGQRVGDAAIRQWPITARDGAFEIPAGAIQQFGEGALFKVYPNAASKAGNEIGYLKAQKVDVMRSRLLAIEYGGKAALSLAEMPRDAVARLADPALKLSITVSAPASRPEGKAYEAADKVFEQLRKESSSGLVINWVGAGEPADLRLEYADDQLWLLPPDGAWVKAGVGKTPSIRLDKPADQLRDVVLDSLQRIGKVLNLRRLAGQSMAGPISGKVDVHLKVVHANSGKSEEISGATVPTLVNGDRLQLTVRNHDYKPVDVTVLGVDSLYGVNLLYPQSAGEANRIGAGDVLKIPSDGEAPIEITADTTGHESIIVVAVEAEPQTPTTNLGFLQQASLEGTRGVPPEGDLDLDNIFMDAGFGGERSRGFARSAPLEKTVFHIFNWITQEDP